MLPIPEGYAFYNIGFEIFCIVAVVILLYKQLTLFKNSKVEQAFTVVLFIQLVYFISFIFRVLIDINYIPQTFHTVAWVTAINFGLFSYCAYRAFILLFIYQDPQNIKLWGNKIWYAIPMLFNVGSLLLTPFFDIIFYIDENLSIQYSRLSLILICINCFYPLASIVSYLINKHKLDQENIDLKVMIAFPLFFAIFGPASALQWRLPILPFGLMLANIIVFIHYSELFMKQRNQALEKEKQVAEEQNKAKSAFLSNMSHDIRTPMNAIIGFTNLALMEIDKRDLVEEYLGKIKSSSDHLLSLINDVLEMSRIESGKIVLNEAKVNLPEIMHNLNTIIIGQVEAKQQELFMDASGVQNENVICDKLRLNQVLLNLVSNAIKYTPAGGKIWVHFIQKDESTDGYANYEIKVKDNGIGMTAEFAAKVFEAFERENTSTVSGIQGTGLGMAITKKIVDLMQGDIQVITAPNEGTEFIVKIRLQTVDQDLNDFHIAKLENIHALVVDDDYGTCDSITGMLENMKIHAEWTLSGKEAILRAKQAKERGDNFGLFIVDWKLPDLDGIEVVRKIKAIMGDSATFLLMTAYDWPSIKDQALEAGVNDFCNKPLFQSELHSALVRMINNKDQKSNQASGKLDTAKNNDQTSIKGMKILLVDDIKVNRQIAVALLSKSGAIVDQAADGKESIEKIKNSKVGDYDAILMDIQMPNMNGYEATKIIRELENKELANIPIFAMTANAFDEDKQAALDAGMNGHIAKPINIEEILAALNSIKKSS